MNSIRPITPGFRTIHRRDSQKANKQKSASKVHLPVPTQRAKPSNSRFANIAWNSIVAAQLLAEPTKRGLKASMGERERFIAAYQSANTPISAKVQKWA